MNLNKLILALEEQGDHPCDTCPHAKTCETESLACEAYRYHISQKNEYSIEYNIYERVPKMALGDAEC